MLQCQSLECERALGASLRPAQPARGCSQGPGQTAVTAGEPGCQCVPGGRGAGEGRAGGGGTGRGGIKGREREGEGGKRRPLSEARGGSVMMGERGGIKRKTQ